MFSTVRKDLWGPVGTMVMLWMLAGQGIAWRTVFENLPFVLLERILRAASFLMWDSFPNPCCFQGDSGRDSQQRGPKGETGDIGPMVQ